MRNFVSSVIFFKNFLYYKMKIKKQKTNLGSCLEISEKAGNFISNQEETLNLFNLSYVISQGLYEDSSSNYS